ncbi:helix-turn-helix domain-containing protein [Agrococcus jenensis]|nr:helix-turn-helix domain-containing protein [Agrococcus jenensis]
MTVESHIGATLAALRTRADLSQAELALLAGAPLATVVGVESGAMEPPAGLVARLTAAIAIGLRGSTG